MQPFKFSNIPSLGVPGGDTQLADALSRFGVTSNPTTTFGNLGLGAPVNPAVPGVQNIANPAAPESDTPADPNFWQSTFLNKNGGLNLNNIGSLAKGIGAFGQMYLGFQANKTAQEALGLQKKAFQTNLDNQTKSYNTALEDRVFARYAQNGRSTDEANSYIKRNKIG